MKSSRDYIVLVLVFTMICATFILASCVTAEQRHSSAPYVSPIQEILYSRTPENEFSPAKNTDPLGNTRWRIANVSPDVENRFRGTEFFFEISGVLVESAELPNGTIYTDTHRYRVLGPTIILTKDGRTTVALFKIEGDMLHINGESYRLILHKINK